MIEESSGLGRAERGAAVAHEMPTDVVQAILRHASPQTTSI
jgi:hypothetical protein